MNRSTYTGYVDLSYTGMANSTLAAEAARHGLVTVSWMIDICDNARWNQPSTPENVCQFGHTDESLREQARLLKVHRISILLTQILTLAMLTVVESFHPSSGVSQLCPGA